MRNPRCPPRTRLLARTHQRTSHPLGPLPRCFPPPASGKRGGSKAHKCLAYARFPAKTINRPHGTGAAFSFSLRGRWLPNWVAPLGSGIEHLSNEVVLYRRSNKFADKFTHP